MRKNTNSAFTLVELIVVITILAVLGTIAFISLQGYSADARNSKRTSDVNNIQSAMWIKQAEGSSLMAFVWTQSNKLASIALGGAAAGAVADADYNVGSPNYTALGVKPDEFKDPAGQEYKIGVTTSSNGKLEIAASLEDGSARAALVKGTYSPRLNTTTGAVTAVSGNIITLSATDTNKFSKGDSVTGTPGWAVTVSKVARDGITITVSDGSAFTTSSTVALTASESLGLVEGITTATTPVTNNGANLPY